MRGVEAHAKGGDLIADLETLVVWDAEFHLHGVDLQAEVVNRLGRAECLLLINGKT